MVTVEGCISICGCCICKQLFLQNLIYAWHGVVTVSGKSAKGDILYSSGIFAFIWCLVYEYDQYSVNVDSVLACWDEVATDVLSVWLFRDVCNWVKVVWSVWNSWAAAYASYTHRCTLNRAEISTETYRTWSFILLTYIVMQTNWIQ